MVSSKSCSDAADDPSRAEDRRGVVKARGLVKVDVCEGEQKPGVGLHLSLGAPNAMFPNVPVSNSLLHNFAGFVAHRSRCDALRNCKLFPRF